MIIKVIGLLLLVAAGAFLGFSAAAGSESPGGCS